MKITGGLAKGLRIETPTGRETRPSTDRLRESLFGMLAALLPEARVVDLFAGSGALGLEAASRGAVEVCWVERHPPACVRIRANLERLSKAGVGCGMKCVCADAFAWLRSRPLPGADLILADPPYAFSGHAGGMGKLLDAISDAGLLAEEGLLVLEVAGRAKLPPHPRWRQLRRADYGSSSVLFLEPGDASGSASSASDPG